jgi:hypothetical protein
MVIFMQTAAYGIYKDGQVFFNEPLAVSGETNVVVVFLDEKPPRRRLTDVFELFGEWEDGRTADEIAEDIRACRLARDSETL